MFKVIPLARCFWLALLAAVLSTALSLVLPIGVAYAAAKGEAISVSAANGPIEPGTP